jgi:hypothetical protein
VILYQHDLKGRVRCCAHGVLKSKARADQKA